MQHTTYVTCAHVAICYISVCIKIKINAQGGACVLSSLEHLRALWAILMHVVARDIEHMSIHHVHMCISTVCKLHKEK